VEVAAICSAQLTRAQALAAMHDVPFATDDYRALLKHVDAVVIATPPGLHAPMGLAAIAAGKHVLCEKPLADSLEAARALRDAARTAGVVHMVNLQLRSAPEYAHAADLAGAGYIGQLTVADVRIDMNPADYLRGDIWSDSKAAWFTDAAQSGGLLASSAGPHMIDLLLWIGGPIVEVAARTLVAQPEVELADGTRATGISSEDGFLILARYASGGLATLRGVPVAHHGGGWALELHGTAGSLAATEGALRGASAADNELLSIDLPEMPDMRIAIATRFADAARAGSPSPAPSFDDGLAIQAVLAASIQAARWNEWVAVPAE
jgi:predicted dehydrogenase